MDSGTAQKHLEDLCLTKTSRSVSRIVIRDSLSGDPFIWREYSVDFEMRTDESAGALTSPHIANVATEKVDSTFVAPESDHDGNGHWRRYV
jgi:hypothetical protein